jgi:transcription initiation factor TFIIF subunit beta
MADPQIKADPETAGESPMPFADDDIYEDAGDLEFNGDPKYQALYLARVPKYIWENWSKLDDDEEIELGTIRVTDEKGPDGSARVLLPQILPSSNL